MFVPSFHPDLVAGVATGAAELHAAGRPPGRGVRAGRAGLRDLRPHGGARPARGRRPRWSGSSLTRHPPMRCRSRPGTRSVRRTRTPSSTAWRPAPRSQRRSRRWWPVRPASSGSPRTRPNGPCASCGRRPTRCPSRPAPSRSPGCSPTPAEPPGATAAVVMTGGNCDSDLVASSGGQSWWCRRSPYVSPSTSAPQDASITLWPTPTVTHDDSPSEVSISTRVTASVPCPWSRMRTL